MFEQVPRRKKGIFVTIAVSAVFVVATGVVLICRGMQSEVYVPGEAIEGVTSTLDRRLPPEVPNVRIVDASESAGIDFRHFPATRTSQLPEDMGSGVSWGDFDGDGWDDLYLANLSGSLAQIGTQREGAPGRNALLRNTQDGRFEDVSHEAGVDLDCLCLGSVWGDYDNDGDLDLFVTAYGKNRLFSNRGDGTFEEATVSAGVEGRDGFWAGASWADYDRDGWLDLYVTGYVRFVRGRRGETTMQYDVESPASINPSSFEPERNLLYRNNSDGTFAEVGEKAGVDNPTGRSLSAAWADFDSDGWVDLYVANDVSDNVFFRNRGDGTFEDISLQALVADYRGAMGLAVADWDGDLDLDLFVTHWIAQENALYSNLSGDRGSRPGQGMGLLRFIDVADRFGLGQIALDVVGWGTFFFDYDNDGRADLFVANGSTLQRRDDPSQMIPMENLLFWNGGPEQGFYEVSGIAGSVFDSARVSRGAAFSDYDRDGDLDVAVSVHGGRLLFLNNQGHPSNHWLGVRLSGKSSNRHGLGSRILVFAGTLELVQEVGSQPSYLSQNTNVAHFGLGSQQRIDTLEVRWPSGRVTRLTDVDVDQVVTVHEDQ
jgi:hypothetical protein